ncbi:uncharacterized protein LOC124438283 [Xenia sp. Carnegie-2017]|uniref:uncharacterized protein LOC124438283 n=1 Tax=Xenia sp. Carnegie-2017 TaxID=2897299 RepID=UPI001F035E7B|nr:uncharacterized protein LOC124438283 [Xenia sp. Carnegie-2017]
MASKNILASPHAKIISRYCRYFLALDLILICIFVYVWYSLCNGSFCINTVSSKSKTNILAFGDSITRGHVKHYPRTYYPYSESLRKTLNRLHAKDVTFIVDNYGVNGDKALGTAETRLASALKSKQYEWIIILIGTNDLGSYFKYHDDQEKYKNSTVFIEALFAKIKKLCSMALGTNALVILGTIFAHTCEERSSYCESLSINRQSLNKKLRDYVFDTRELLILADFDNDLCYRKLSEEKRKLYWQDDVHLTEAGYERMAKLIYQKMLPYLPEMVQQQSQIKSQK